MRCAAAPRASRIQWQIVQGEARQRTTKTGSAGVYLFKGASLISRRTPTKTGGISRNRRYPLISAPLHVPGHLRSAWCPQEDGGPLRGPPNAEYLPAFGQVLGSAENWQVRIQGDGFNYSLDRQGARPGEYRSAHERGHQLGGGSLRYPLKSTHLARRALSVGVRDGWVNSGRG
jgi:hypothetical protein